MRAMLGVDDTVAPRTLKKTVNSGVDAFLRAYALADE
jgi:AefR-like transcriptional repressor, C-terminal domain